MEVADREEKARTSFTSALPHVEVADREEKARTTESERTERTAAAPRTRNSDCDKFGKKKTRAAV